jgi:hypothetical protein
MCPHRAGRDAELRRHFRCAADFDDGQQNAQFSGSEVVERGDDIGRPGVFHARLVDHHCGKRLVRAVAVRSCDGFQEAYMADTMRTVGCYQRQRTRHYVRRIVAGSQGQAQASIGLRIAGNQTAAARAQHVLGSEKPACRGIGVEDPHRAIHDEQSCAEAIDRIGKRCGLCPAANDIFADLERPAHMRHDHSQTPSRVVGDAGATAHRRARRQFVARLLQHGIRFIEPFPGMQSAVEETARAGVDETTEGVENACPLCRIK